LRPLRSDADRSRTSTTVVAPGPSPNVSRTFSSRVHAQRSASRFPNGKTTRDTSKRRVEVRHFCRPRSGSPATPAAYGPLTAGGRG
jgi:hypothetical protein